MPATMKGYQAPNTARLPNRSLASAVMHGAQTMEDLRALSPMPPDAQRLIDDAVVSVGLSRLTLVADLLAEGLVRPLPNWLAVPTLFERRQGRAGHAQRSMVPKARGERQIIDEDGVTTPIFATWDDFSFDVRTIATANRSGYDIETSHVTGATRNVNEAIEDQAINGLVDEAGNLIKVAGNPAPGLLNATGVNTYQYLGGATGRAWTDAAKTGEHILSDVIDMIEIAVADNYTGPYNLYVPTLYGLKLMQDFKSATSGTIMSRLQELEAGDRPLRIRPTDQMPANRTALVQMTSDVVDVIEGQRPAELSWEDGPGFESFSIVMACMIVRVKSNYDGASGVVIGNTTA